MSRSIDRLTSLDRLMLGASERWPQDIGALAILDGTILLDPTGELRIDAVREAIASRLHLVPRFRQVIHVPGRGLGGPLWVDAPRFDIRDHVVVLTLPPGTDQPGLLAVIEELRSQRFDPSRPLWRMWFMPDPSMRSSNGARCAVAEASSSDQWLVSSPGSGPADQVGRIGREVIVLLRRLRNK